MLTRSIPQYRVMREACVEVGSRYVRPGTDVVDVGCSRGEALDPFLREFGGKARLVGLEVSPPRLWAARGRFADAIDVFCCNRREWESLEDRERPILELKLQGCSVTEIAQRLGVCPQTVRDMIDRKELPGIRFGKQAVMFDAENEAFSLQRLGGLTAETTTPVPPLSLDWPAGAGIGKTLVSSDTIDRVAAALGRRLVEVPVGFKWFVDGLLDTSLGFGCEESAGASCLRLDGTVWSTDKDGIVLALLAAELYSFMGSVFFGVSMWKLRERGAARPASRASSRRRR